MPKNVVLIAEHRLPANVCKTRILVIKPISPLSTSLDLDHIEKIELITIDDRFIASYVRVCEIKH